MSQDYQVNKNELLCHLSEHHVVMHFPQTSLKKKMVIGVISSISRKYYYQILQCLKNFLKYFVPRSTSEHNTCHSVCAIHYLLNQGSHVKTSKCSALTPLCNNMCCECLAFQFKLSFKKFKKKSISSSRASQRKTVPP